MKGINVLYSDAVNAGVGRNLENAKNKAELWWGIEAALYPCTGVVLAGLVLLQQLIGSQRDAV